MLWFYQEKPGKTLSFPFSPFAFIHVVPVDIRSCGKSTRVPLYIYEDSVKHREKCKIIICQPRRIAVINLKNRLREALGDKVRYFVFFFLE